MSAPLAQLVEVVEAQAEEGRSEEGVEEGQHPRVQHPHHGQLQVIGRWPDTVKHNFLLFCSFFGGISSVFLQTKFTQRLCIN